MSWAGTVTVCHHNGTVYDSFEIDELVVSSDSYPPMVKMVKGGEVKLQTNLPFTLDIPSSSEGLSIAAWEATENKAVLFSSFGDMGRVASVILAWTKTILVKLMNSWFWVVGVPAIRMVRDVCK